jgi:hypothetical protein
MSKNWKAGDTIIAKGSKAKVIAFDLSDGQNWVTVQYAGQEYQGYQAEFEAKGWKKSELQITSILGWFFGLLFALMGLSLLGLAPFSGLLFLIMSAVLLPPVTKLINGTPLRSAASGSCDCPYDVDKRGRACGARSAYNRPSGKRPKCYVGD